MDLDLERIFKECGYSPEKIGIAILRMTGKYAVEEWFYSDDSPPSVYLKTNDENAGSFLWFENENGEIVHSSKDGKAVYGKLL